MEKKQIKPKISLTGSLASLAKEVQTETVNIEEPKIEVSEGKDLDFYAVVDLAKKYRENKPKPATMYVAENIKKDLERLKSIEDFDKIPLIALASAILDHFLSVHETEIKNLMSEMKGRFK